MHLCRSSLDLQGLVHTFWFFEPFGVAIYTKNCGYERNSEKKQYGYGTDRSDSQKGLTPL